MALGVKVWGKTKEFTASIETQRPDERIKWKATQGVAHTGVVTFHELGPRLTRVLLGLDLEPGSLVEKAGRGMRHVKRAARGDLHRFKAFIEMQEVETGAWRGRIEDGAVVEEHDSGYDDGRQYSDPKAILGGPDEDEAAPGTDHEERPDEKPRAGRGRGGQRSRGRSRTGNGASSEGRGQRSSASSASRESGRASARSGRTERSRSGATGRRSNTRGRQAARKNN